jgi:hypothetical protein
MQGRARNFAMKYLKDTDLWFLTDADDIQYPEKLSKLVNVYIEYPEEIGIVYASYHIKHLSDEISTYEVKPNYSKENLMRGDCMIHSNCIFSRTATDKVGLFFETESPKEDMGLWIRITDYFMAVHVPEPLTEVRITGKNSAVVQSQERHQKAFEQMIQNYNEWRSKNA